MTLTSVKRWSVRRRKLTLDNGTVLEFVPGRDDGERAYFWIGTKDGDHFATVDARTLENWLDTVATTE